MNISQLKESRFLKKDDVMRPILVTIKGVTQENLALQGQPPEFKWILHFMEPNSKPMVLNSTNGQIIAQILGSDETDHWTGKQIVLYNDPSISFQGRLTGGIRVRAPRTASQTAPRPASPPPPAPVAPTPAAAPAPGPFDDEPPMAGPGPGMPVEDDDVPF